MLGRSDRARQDQIRAARAALQGAASIGASATTTVGADVEAAVEALGVKLDDLNTKAAATNTKLDTAIGHLAAIETNTAGP